MQARDTYMGIQMPTDNEITGAAEDALKFKAWTRTSAEITSGILSAKREGGRVLWEYRIIN